MENERKIILSIETAVGGGSVSIFEDGKEIGSWVGQADVSKAEDVLDQIQKLFEKHRVEKKFVNLITVSSGPGSSTGIKIGLSLAKGLGKALDCRIIAVSALEALLSKANVKTSGSVLTALPVGRNFIAWQIFDKKVLTSNVVGDSQISDLKTFIEILKTHNYSQAVLHNKIYELTDEKQITPDNKFITDAGKNLAVMLAEKTYIPCVR